MNYKIYLKPLTAIAFSIMMLNSCVKSDQYEVPPITCQDKFGPTNHQLTDLKTIAKEKPDADDIIKEDYIVEGYVSSSDESGNIYKMLFIQDKPENPTFAIEVDINGANQHVDYPEGAKVRMNLKGLIVQEEFDNVKVGSYDAQYAVGRIEPDVLEKYISRTCGTNGSPVLVEMVPLEFTSIQEALKPENTNKLIKIKNVQFHDDELAKNFADATKTGDRYIIDNQGTKLDFRFSNYADFSTQKIAPEYQGSGDITFILSRFRNSFQGYISKLSDINFKQSRFTLTIIDFEEFSDKATDLSPYHNISVIGNALWRVASFSNNKYIQLSAYNRGNVKTHLAISTKFNGKNKLSFESNSSFYNGDVLKVYWSTDYNPAKPDAGTLHDITTKFDISKSTKYEKDYRPSGIGELPATATGDGFIIFEYTGSDPSPTTTMQLDNIRLN